MSDLLSLTGYNSIIKRENRSVLDTRGVQYVKSKPLNVLDRIELNDDLVQGRPQDAYRDISELVVDSLLKY